LAGVGRVFFAFVWVGPELPWRWGLIFFPWQQLSFLKRLFCYNILVVKKKKE